MQLMVKLFINELENIVTISLLDNRLKQKESQGLE